MTVYFIYLALISFQWWGIKHLSVNGITVEEQSRKRRKYFLIIACVELIILAGIRGYSVGADTSVYLSALEYYKALPKDEILRAELVYPYDFETGYFFLTKLCAWLGFSKTAFLFLIAVIIYIPMFVAIYKQSLNPYLSILTYFSFSLFAYSLGIFRQMIALAIVVCGIEYVKNRNFFKYLLLVCIAMTFHSTAILSLAIYFLYPLKWNMNALVLFVISGIALFFGPYIVELMILLMPKYKGYIDGEWQSGGSYLMLILFVAIFVLIYVENKKQSPTATNKLAFDALALTILVQSIGYSLNIFGRAIGFFSVYLLFLIPNYVELVVGKWRILVTLGVVLCLFAITFNNLKGSLSYIDYTIFFANK